MWIQMCIGYLCHIFRKIWSSGVSPKLQLGLQGATSETVYLPGTQKWYDVKTGATYPAGQKVNVPVTMDGIPVFQRAGSIIARKQRRRRSSTQMETDPYTLVFFTALKTCISCMAEIIDRELFNLCIWR